MLCRFSLYSGRLAHKVTAVHAVNVQTHADAINNCLVILFLALYAWCWKCATEIKKIMACMDGWSKMN